MLFILKAQVRGAGTADLFAAPVLVAAHVREGHIVKPHTAIRYKAPPQAQAALPLQLLMVQQVHHEAPPAPKPAGPHWLNDMGQEAKSGVLGEMRKMEAEIQRYYNAPSQGGSGIAVGSAGHDDIMEAEVRREFLSVVGKGGSPAQAAEHANRQAVVFIEKHNSRRPGDKDWKRWTGGFEAKIGYLKDRLNRAAKPPPAKPMVMTTERPKPVDSGPESRQDATANKPVEDRPMETSKFISRLVEIGGKEWSSADGTKRRVYFELAPLLGWEYGTYGTGNISWAKLKGEAVSNTKAKQRLLSIEQKKLWFDVQTREVGTRNVSDGEKEEALAALNAKLGAGEKVAESPAIATLYRRHFA